MSKWIYLCVLVVVLLIANHFLGDMLYLHSAFNVTVIFFSALTFCYFRLDHWISKEWRAQVALIKIGLRFVISSVFIVVMIYTQEDDLALVIQFISLYLIFMVFEIAVSLTNLRGN
ncbi:MAG: hypothetical protein AAGA66_01970 [Bacteroidota bacterium]